MQIEVRKVDIETVTLSAKSALFCCLFTALSSVAEVDPITQAYNQLVVFKRLCVSGASKKEVQNLYEKCAFPAKLADSIATNKSTIFGAQAALEALVFREAGLNQMSKNQCLIEKFRNIMEDENRRNEYEEMVTNSALRLRKTELILKKCQEYDKVQNLNKYNRSINASRRDENGQIVPLNPPLKIHKKWEEICSNPNTIKTFKEAKSLFLLTLPVIHSEKIFKIIMDNRDSLLNLRTKKAITDADLLNTDERDMTTMDWISYRHPKLNPAAKNKQNQLIEFFNSQIDQRQNTNDKLKKLARKNGLFDIPDNMKEYLYNDGSLLEIMRDLNMIDESPLEQQKSYSEAAVCILSKYQSAPIEVQRSELTAAMFFLLTKVSKGLSTVPAIVKTHQAGKILSSYWVGDVLTKQLAAGCTKQGIQDKLSLNQTPLIDRNSPDLQFPKEMAIEKYILQFDPTRIPSCRYDSNPTDAEHLVSTRHSDARSAVQTQEALMNNSSLALAEACATKLLLNGPFLPLKIALPSNILIHAELEKSED